MDKIEIKTQKLLLVEGNDDEGFFQKLIEVIKISNIQILSVGGKDGFRTSNLKSIKNMPGFRELRALGIVRDADENANDTFTSICTILRSANLPVPSQPMEIVDGTLRIGILIIPPHASKGKIENLCLASIKEHKEMECIDNYFKCLRKRLSSDRYPKDLSKAKIQAFLASREESVPHLGIAAQREYFPFDCEIFDEIKNFLRAL